MDYRDKEIMTLRAQLEAYRAPKPEKGERKNVTFRLPIALVNDLRKFGAEGRISLNRACELAIEALLLF